jgi:hypothetical protein
LFVTPIFKRLGGGGVVAVNINNHRRLRGQYAILRRVLSRTKCYFALAVMLY